MPYRLLPTRGASALLAAPLLWGFVSFGVDRPCQEETLAHLERLKINRERVKKIHIRTDAQAGRGGTRIQGHKAWVQLKDCDGDLVIEMRRFCEFKQAFTTRNCSLPGVPRG